MEDVYDDVSHVDLGSQISRLEEQNKILLNHINKLEEDIRKLCTELTNMKEIQQNLSRNISELFKTAKIELQRKDRMISELRQEIDRLGLNSGERPKKFKRKLHDRGSNDSSKRFKRNSIDPEVNRKSSSPARSTPTIDNIETEPHDIQENNLSKISRNYKNDHYHHSNRYSPNEDYGRYHSMDARYERRNYNRCTNNSKFRRSSSRDRYRKNNYRDKGSRSGSRDKGRRSKSNDRYNRNQNRWKRSRTPERSNKGYKNVTKENYEYSDHFSNKNFDDFDHDNRSIHKTKGKTNTSKFELLDLTEDIEDGEITPEYDALIIEENVEDVHCLYNRQSNVPSKLESKPITIDEYRSRKKHLEDEREKLIGRQNNEYSESKLSQNFDERERPEFPTNINKKTHEVRAYDNNETQETTTNDKAAEPNTIGHDKIQETITSSNDKMPEANLIDNIKPVKTRTSSNDETQQISKNGNNKTSETTSNDNNKILETINSNNKIKDTTKWNDVQNAEIATRPNEIPKEKCVTNNNELQNTIVGASPHILNAHTSNQLVTENSNTNIPDKTSSDFNPNTSNTLNDSGNTSVNSDNSFLNNSGNICNTSNSNLTKARRRRCVVIGLKEKT